MVVDHVVLSSTRPGDLDQKRAGPVKPARARSRSRGELPEPLARLLELLGPAAAPAALFAIGLSLVGRSLSGQLGEVAWLALLKRMVQPFFTWLLVAYVFELDPFRAGSAVILAALPAGALVFVASQFNVKVATGSAAIIVTTALSVVTRSLLLVWLGVG